MPEPTTPDGAARHRSQARLEGPWIGPSDAPSQVDIDKMDSLPETELAATGTVLTRLQSELTDPTLLVLPLVAGAFCLMRWLHLIAPDPYWVYVAIIIGAGLVRLAHSALWAGSHRPWQRNANIGASMAVIGVVAYCTGWGPILSIGFIFGAATALQTFDSTVIWPCLLWTTAVMALGQIAIVVHFAPTLIKEPTVQGVAGLGLLGALLVIELLGRAAADQEKLADELRRSERRFSALVTRSSDIIMVVSADGSIQYASPAFEAVLGYPIGEAQRIHGPALIHPDDIVGLRAALAATSSPDATVHQEIRLLSSAGDYLWFEAAMTNLTNDPDVNGIVANMRDITRRKDAEERLAHTALHDSLTGLPNRSLILNRIEQMHAPGQTAAHPDCSSVHRPRQLQGHQRHAGSRGGGSTLGGSGGQIGHRAPRGGHGGSARGRRVRRPGGRRLARRRF